RPGHRRSGGDLRLAGKGRQMAAPADRGTGRRKADRAARHQRGRGRGRDAARPDRARHRRLMRVWRVCRAAFADLGGEGARLHGGGWNSPGRPVVYTAENPALAILEVRVRLDLEPGLIPDDYVLIEIDLAGVAC